MHDIVGEKTNLNEDCITIGSGSEQTSWPFLTRLRDGYRGPRLKSCRNEHRGDIDFWIAPSRRPLGVMSSYFASRRPCARIFMKIMFWMTIRMISTDFDGISDDLPDVYINITSSSKIISSSKITSSSKIIIKNRFFIFASETFLGHLGGVGRLYLDDLDWFRGDF